MSDHGSDMSLIPEHPKRNNRVPAFFVNDDGELQAHQPWHPDQADNQVNRHRTIFHSHWISYLGSFDAIWCRKPDEPGAHNRIYAADSVNTESGLLYRDGVIVGLFLGLMFLSSTGNLCLLGYPGSWNKKGCKILWTLMGSGLQLNRVWLDYQQVETFMQHNGEIKSAYNPIVPGPVVVNNGKPVCAFMNPSTNKPCDFELSLMIHHQIAFLITFEMIIYFHHITSDEGEKSNIPDYLARIIEDRGADVIKYEAYDNTTHNVNNRFSPLFPIHTLPLRKIISRGQYGIIYQADVYNECANTLINNDSTGKRDCKLSSIIVQTYQFVKQFVIPNFANEGYGFQHSFLARMMNSHDNIENFIGPVIRPDFIQIFNGDMRRHIVIGPDRTLTCAGDHFLSSLDPGEKAVIINESIAYWTDFYKKNIDPAIDTEAQTLFTNSELI